MFKHHGVKTYDGVEVQVHAWAFSLTLRPLNVGEEAVSAQRRSNAVAVKTGNTCSSRESSRVPPVRLRYRDTTASMSQRVGSVRNIVTCYWQQQNKGHLWYRISLWFEIRPRYWRLLPPNTVTQGFPTWGHIHSLLPTCGQQGHKWRKFIEYRDRLLK